MQGIPQGNSASPLYAFCFCIYQEDEFFKSIYDGTHLVTGEWQYANSANTPLSSNKRYFDDCRLVVQYDSSSRESKAAAQQYIDKYAEVCYHQSVTIIPEPAGSGFSFLQGNFVFNPTFTAFYESKNYQHWIQHGTLKTILLQYYYSYCESYSKQRFVTLVGKLHEIMNFSYPRSQARRGLASILPDLAQAEYPWPIIAAAIYEAHGEANRVQQAT